MKQRFEKQILESLRNDLVITVIGRNKVCAAIRLIDRGLLKEVDRLIFDGQKTPFYIKVKTK